MRERKPTRFLRKGSGGRVLHYTDFLARRKDMIECDINGMPLGMVARKTSGIQLPKPDVQVIAPEPENEPGQEVIEVPTGHVDLSGLKRSEIVAKAKELFGSEADYLKAGWSTDRLIEEFGLLQAAAELRSDE